MRRLTRGVLGFVMNYLLVGLVTKVSFKATAANYVCIGFINCFTGFLCYGVLPLFYEMVGLINYFEPMEDEVIPYQKNYTTMEKYMKEPEMVISEKDLDYSN